MPACDLLKRFAARPCVEFQVRCPGTQEAIDYR